ncbi:glycosyltransferase family 2 protein [Xylella taiwanensis]|nr:glycosyltransferase family 2 protein [Xylella taiwanensis]MCD8456493.1 glycosyltransferase family 2 protein [Xylella taiwanensis]MCD8458900.1 glycosyltransferase family 2 protein [Xylella taiwanensis]MCD8461038.1 glycosyltransferase family 2 protein [Xylella taiwanensis]MCD8462902.1 glycosyltransferase family 2 protein [Xylella taiwanensis]MCD8465543.1 glycosyltransferase family 2 protein [Xylella taiwanensis]
MAVVVVTFQSASTIDVCLTRLRAATDVAEICVVDNGSHDDTLKIVQCHALLDPRLRFVANLDNPGFAAACNQGAADVTSPWLVFVNPDLMVEPETLAQLRAYAETHAPALLGVEQVDEGGCLDPAVRRRDPDFAAMLRNPRRGTQLAIPADPTQSLQPVPALSGALMLMPRTLFEHLGGWDVRYRLHAEDLDLCRRARVAGATVAVVNTLQVVHLRGVSSRSRPFFVELHKHRGLWRYFCKFEAAQRSLLIRSVVWLAIWSHAFVQWLRLWLREPKDAASRRE